ncbi:MAG: hypothetical protein AAGC46_20810 [Solirubrobacteraceae bacterium]|nr:hypothetical protein [Patulibacter sp.]
MRRALAPFLLILGVLFGVAAPAGAAGALTWSPAASVETGKALSTVACPSTTLCVAGGANDTIAVTADPAGGAWSSGAATVSGSTGTVTALTCPTATLCIAGDDAGHLLVSTNPAGGASTWTATTYAGARFNDLSCSSASSCVATDPLGSKVWSTGTPGNAASWTSKPSAQQAWNSVSCTPSFCVASSALWVYYSTSASAAPAAWTASKIVPFNGSSYSNRLTAVACTAAPACVVGDDIGDALFATKKPSGVASDWSSTAFQQVSNLSCAPDSTGLCVGSSVYGGFVFSSTDPAGGSGTWSSTDHVLGAGMNVADVSCPTSSLCVAVGGGSTSGLAAVATAGGGGAPTPTPTPTPTGDPTPVVAPTPTPAPVVGGSIAPPSGPSLGTVGGSPGLAAGSGTTFAVSGNAVSFLLQSASNATGTVTVSTGAAVTASAARATKKTTKKKPKAVILGTATFTLVANVKKTVMLKLNATGRKQLAAKRKLKVFVTITGKTSAGTKTQATSSATLTLKKASKH